jgi:hypothetical protein
VSEIAMSTLKIMLTNTHYLLHWKVHVVQNYTVVIQTCQFGIGNGFCLVHKIATVERK